MRRIFALLTVLSLSLSYLVLFSPKSVSAAAQDQLCFIFEATYRNDTNASASVTWTLTDHPNYAADYGSATLTLAPGATGTLHLAGFLPADVIPGAKSPGTSLTFISADGYYASDSACGGTGFGRINDGRLNAYDLAAPLATYCAEGGMSVWDIDATGHGTLGFTATKQQIADALAQAKSSGQNVLIAERLGNSLYALSSNELSLIGPDVKEPGKTYSHVMAGDVCG